MQLALVREAFDGYVDEVVLGEVQVLQLRVELHGAVDGLDFVVADDEPLDGGVECYGEDVEAALLAHHHEGVVVAAAAARAVGQRRGAASPRQELQGYQHYLKFRE